ncbi:MAG: PepSY domain-containing protein [Azoarcus sp.]|nr:PepSY domain-containing protein [Azoarcus sp.]
MASDAQDHEQARRALEAGEVMPLRAIIDVVERDHPGQIVEIELERDDGRWLYEIKLLRADGSLAKLKVDGRDGRVLSIRGRDDDGRKRSEQVR